MSYNELKEMNRITKKLGLKTFGDLYNFKQREQDKGETLLQALRRYEKELGAEFEIGG